MPFITRLPALTGADPYPDALLALDFVGARRGPQYYKALGVTTADITKVPGWTYTGGTPAGTGSYAARQDGSLQFFPSYTNLLLYSQAFTTGGWSNNIVYMTPNQSGAPDGTSTATLFTPPASAGSWDFRQSATHTVASYTLSIYAKPNGYDRIAFRENTTSGSYVVASLTGAGSILSNSGGTSTITAVANGWYRLTMTWTGAAVSQQMSVYVVGPGYTSGSPNAYSWTPNGTSGVYFWGAQDELGSTASTYIPTTTAAVTVGTPRITDAGYWAEEARTNYLPTSAAPAGSGWVASKTASGITATKIATGTEYGLTYADYSFVGTASATSFDLGLAESTRTTASVGQTWTASIYARVIAGTTNGVTSINYAEVEETTGNVYYGLTNSGNLPTDGSFSRIAATRTLAAATAASTRSTVILYIVSGQAVNITVRFYQPQLELGSFATSPIPTTTAAVTRAADVGYVSGLVVPSVKTLFANVSALAQDGVERTLMSVNDGSSVNRVNLYRNSSNAMQSVSTVASTSAYTNAVGSFAGAFVTSAATSVSAAEMVTAAAGATTPVRATSSVAMATVSVGTGPAGSQPMNGSIRRIVIYPRAFGNAELQAITTAGAY